MFNKEVQYGLLFTIYLCRAGRATTTVAAQNLNVPKPFLDQVARRLRLANVLKSSKGPGGGYELVGHPLVQDVIQALSTTDIIDAKQLQKYSLGKSEHRALANYAKTMAETLKPLYNNTVRQLGNDLVVAELYKMENTQGAIS